MWFPPLPHSIPTSKASSSERESERYLPEQLIYKGLHYHSVFSKYHLTLPYVCSIIDTVCGHVYICCLSPLIVCLAYLTLYPYYLKQYGGFASDSWIKHLLGKCEDRSSDCQQPNKGQVGVAAACNLSTQ